MKREAENPEKEVQQAVHRLARRSWTPLTSLQVTSGTPVTALPTKVALEEKPPPLGPRPPSIENKLGKNPFVIARAKSPAKKGGI